MTVLRPRNGIVCFVCLLVLVGGFCLRVSLAQRAPLTPEKNQTIHRSPVDLVLFPDEQYLATANQTSGSVSLVHVPTGEVKAEIAVGKKPCGLALSPDGKQLVVTSTEGGDLVILDRSGEKLKEAGRVRLSFEPRGVALSPDGKKAYVALTTGNEVAVVDVLARKVEKKIKVGRWPRYLALTRDGKKLAVGANGDGGVSVVDLVAGKMLYQEDFIGMNLGQMETSADGKYVYFPWMVYRSNPINHNNIRLGWVLASRIARVKLDGPTRREAISLDPKGMAIADPHGLALSPDEQWLVCSASGSQELLVYKLPTLPFLDYGGGDHIDADLLKDKDRFYRIDLGGRPMAARYGKDGKTVYVANYLGDAVQVVDVEGRKIVRTLKLGGPQEPSLVRKGEALFFDGKRSLDQWYSCHSCHYEGHTNAWTMDTNNDGTAFTFKTVLSLRNVTRTGPWTWHGWQKDLNAAMKKSFTDTLRGKPLTDDETKAIIAYLDTLTSPPSPFRNDDGSLTEAAQRGEKIFTSTKANCASCHRGVYYTDGKIHDVGTGKPRDIYKGYNPPSLLGVHDRVLLLHDGRAKSLEEALRGPHNPARLTGGEELTDGELRDLIEYLKSL